jgi:hypothetical protein
MAAQEQHKALKKTKWEAKTPYRKFATVMTKILFAIFLLGIINDISRHGQQTNSSMNIDTVLSVIVVGGLFLVWMPVILMAIHRAIGEGFDELNVASTPIPSPAEISWQLENEWGRPATIEEVAAVHQMLTSRKNQALINSGITFGAIYLMGRNL